MKYLITGAAGFIGSNLCWALTNQGKDVVGIDCFLTGSNPLNLQGWSGKFIYTDLTEKYQVKSLFQKYKFDYIIHLAAETHVDRSLTNPSSFWSNNVIGTNYLLKEIYHQNYAEMVINVITDEVFGATIELVPESHPFNPSSPYAASKVAQYYIGHSYYMSYKVPVVSTFPCNTYGPRQYPEKLIPKFTLRLLNNLKVPLMRTTTAERTWMYIDDHINAILILLDRGVIGSKYNISTYQKCSNQELVELLLQYTSKDKSYIEIVPDRQHHDLSYQISSYYIRMLDWKPKILLEDGLKKTVEWYIEHPNHYPRRIYC